MGLPPKLTLTSIRHHPNSHPQRHRLRRYVLDLVFGYIFVKYEGKFALETGTQLLEPVSYHCGTDASYRTVTWNCPSRWSSLRKTANLTLTLDAAKALMARDAIDLAVDPVTHNEPGDSLGGRMMDLLMDAWKISVE